MSLQTRARVDDEQFEAIYVEYFDFMVQIAVFKFRVPDTEAETLVHDVLYSYLKKKTDVLNLRRWLIGAICFASRHYWRLNGRTVPVDAPIQLDRVDPASARILDSLPDQLAAREALERLSPRAQEVLTMRFFGGFSVAEIAAKYGIKPKSAQKLITKCLRRAERLYGTKAEVRK